MLSERMQGVDVGGDSVIREVSRHNPPQPLTLLCNRVMPPAPQLITDVPQRCAHAITLAIPAQQESCEKEWFGVFPGLSRSIRSPLVRFSGHTVQTISARRLRVAPPRALRPAYFSSFAMAYSLHRPARYAAGGGGGGFGGRPWIHRTQSRDRSLCANGQRTCDAGGDP